MLNTTKARSNQEKYECDLVMQDGFMHARPSATMDDLLYTFPDMSITITRLPSDKYPKPESWKFNADSGILSIFTAFQSEGMRAGAKLHIETSGVDAKQAFKFFKSFLEHKDWIRWEKPPVVPRSPGTIENPNQFGSFISDLYARGRLKAVNKFCEIRYHQILKSIELAGVEPLVEMLAQYSKIFGNVGCKDKSLALHKKIPTPCA